jgi:hypothetical protein
MGMHSIICGSSSSSHKQVSSKVFETAAATQAAASMRAATRFVSSSTSGITCSEGSQHKPVDYVRCIQMGQHVRATSHKQPALLAS